MVSTSGLFAGRYLLGSLLGQGGMSDVYEAVDQDTGNRVAVKVVRSGDPELARRLGQEVRVHQRMEHPGLIRLLDAGQAEGQAYLVMELVEGATLAASLQGAPLGTRLTAKLGGIVSSALAYVHAQGIVHRDVKPSNILLAADGRALLGDFGIARLLNGSTFTIDGTTLGTVAYMAPEQLEDHQVGPGADIWSLGLVLLECLLGRRVYEGTSSEILARRLAGPVPLPVDLPAPWKLLLNGMLDHEPGQRPDGGQVASLLASTAFTTAWSPAQIPDGAPGAATVPLGLTDLTDLAPGHQPVAAYAPGDTRVGAPPLPLAQPATGTRKGWLVALILVVVAATGGGVAVALESNPVLSHPQAHGGAGSHPTTTTTAPRLTVPAALAALVSDVAAGVDAGNLSARLGQSLTDLAQQAVDDEAAGMQVQAAQDLAHLAATISSSLQSGTIAPSAGATLQGDLSALAVALGLGAAATPPSTTAPSTPAPPGGKKSGPGPGNSDHGGHG
ncbi:MAG TPA: serine/threonine-protein kinase [Acidimicrobiales bacterium]|nr:serine/threonine-protein kinase [Acidimicrobiales bacterium]